MKIILALSFFALLGVLWPVQVQASNILFEHRDRTYLSRDVVFERNRMVTSSGFLDVHILEVPLNDPYISLAPVESRREMGLRETTLNLLAESGAIAGTNADFFGMGGTHTTSFGPVIANGQLISITEAYNLGSNEFAAFFLDENNVPMLRYITPRIWFTVNGLEVMRVNSINKAANMYRPLIVNRWGMSDTSSLSARFPNLRKMVVDNGIVQGIFDHPVIVPYNGFVVVMNQDDFYSYMPWRWFGFPAEYQVFTNLGRNLDEIQTAVGGGGLILQHGTVVHDGGTVIAGRHPRTALGFTSDWSRLILMAVDGRGFSIGATHEEMAALMLRYGATEAMHLDGGGSTTMVAQAGGRGTPLQVVNRVSEGTQRRIINALGVFDHSTPGPVNQLVLTPYNRYITLGTPLVLDAYGLDLYLHRAWVNPAALMFSVYTIESDGQRLPATGTWQGNAYFPDRPGLLYVRAQYYGFSVSKTYVVQDIVAIQFLSGGIATALDGAVPFAFNGITATGASVPSLHLGHVQLSVYPPDIGIILDQTFIPNIDGGAAMGHVIATMGSINAHLPVLVVNAYSHEIDPAYLAYFAAQLPQQTPIVDPIRTPMTTVVPGHAFDFSVAMPGYGSFAYFARPEGPAAIVQMTAAGGGIFATDRSQWGRFLPDINMMNPNFVIIRMDVNPLRALGRDELDLFHNALITQHELGRTVFVISNVEYSSSFSLRDGIRYIDLGNAGYDSSIWFRAIEGQIWYDF